MIDQSTETSGGVNPAGVSKEFNPQRPIDDEMARDCIRQLREIARTQNLGPFVLPNLRTASIPDLFDSGDPNKGKEPGMLRKAGWQDDQPTREFLENAQRYAERQAEEGIQTIQKELGLTLEQLGKMSFDELVKLAKTKGLLGEAITDNPLKQERVEETIDYLRNAWEKAAGGLIDIHTETEEGVEVIGNLKIISDRAEEVILNIIANGANNPQEVYIKQGERLVGVILPEGKGIGEFLAQGEELPPDQKAKFEEQKRALALAYDLQITGVTEKLRKVKYRTQKENLEARLQKLKKERQLLKTKDEKGDEVVIPDQIGVFAAKFNCRDLSEVRTLFERAASDSKVREGLLEYIINIGLADKEAVEKVLDKIHGHQERKKWARRVRSLAGLALVLTLLLAWQASKADKKRSEMIG